MTWTDRFAAAWQLDPETGCHLWRRGKNSRGYGVFWLNGKLRLAHRVAWWSAAGRWPTSPLVLDHLCDVKACVNADHLTEVSNRHNILRSPRSPMNVRAARTACGRGHSYVPGSWWRDSKGHRQCHVCREIREGRWTP